MSSPLNSVFTSLSSNSVQVEPAANQTSYFNDSNRQLKKKTQALTSELQKSLDPKEVIELFSSTCFDIFPHDGVQYTNDAVGLDIQLGRTSLHHCNYRLIIAEDNLGEITFTRSRKFSDEDTSRLEHLLCSLIYPLRNALLYQQALQSALRDPLTGLQNRAAMDSTLQRETRLAGRHETPLSLLVMDVDWFKSINDKYGHSAGDSVLQALTQCALKCIRSTDMLFRYGGEEFVILMSNTDRAGAELMARRIRESIEALNITHGQTTIQTSVSIGLAQFHIDDNSSTLFDRADQALYMAKEQGRNRVYISPQ